MPKLKIHKRSVEAAVAGEATTFFWDSELAGFGLKVTPAGSKTFVVQYRMGGRATATRRYTIGPYGTWEPGAARNEAERLLRLAGCGVDPQAVAKERERADRDLAFTPYAAKFLTEYGKPKWRPRYFISAESNMRRWIMTVLGRKSLLAISRRDITEVIDRVPEGSRALKRSIFALLRKLFNWAVERGDLERSPMEKMKPPEPVEARDRVLTDQELIYVLAFCEDLGEPFCSLIRLLIVTGQRRDEVASMRWSELNRASLEWSLPRARVKNRTPHIVPLSDIAIAELDALAGGERWPRTGFVFSTTGRTPVSGFTKIKRRLDASVGAAMKREIPGWTLHDLRRTFATNMQRLKVRFEVTEALLNHASGSRAGVVGVYQRHDWIDEKHEAAELWAERLRLLMAAENMRRFDVNLDDLPNLARARSKRMPEQANSF